MRPDRCLKLLAILYLLLSALPLRSADKALSAEEKQWLAASSCSEKEGWTYLHLEGKPFVRGFQHGYRLAGQIKKVYATESHYIYCEIPRDMDYFVQQAKFLFAGKVPEEFAQELLGMAAGLERAGVKGIGYDELVAHNACIEVVDYWWPWARKNEAGRAKNLELGGCSAFVATGSYTRDGNVVLAHNTWFDYSVGSWCNVVADIVPDQGNRILMQTMPGLIHSGTDFFVCSSGIVGAETTIGGFSGYDTTGTPEFCRMRQAMQYASSIDDWARIMVERNSGGYANSWLIGDIRSGEIACLELGAKFHHLEKTRDGYFCGSNIAADRNLRLNETSLDYTDIRLSNVARRVSWLRLMKEYRGKIDAEAAKSMLASHYDAYLKVDKPGYRTICGHNELDPGDYVNSKPPFRPAGALDGKVVVAGMARNMSFWARWGSSCGRAFFAEPFLEEHPQYDWLSGYLVDRPSRDWVVFEEKH